FRPEKIARYGKRDVRRLLRDEGIVRNRLKIAATIENAKMFLAVRKEFGTFYAYLWNFVGGKPIQNRWRRMADVPARTAESDAMSRDLLRRGFKFVGSTSLEPGRPRPANNRIKQLTRLLLENPTFGVERLLAIYRSWTFRLLLCAVRSAFRRLRTRLCSRMLIIARGAFRVRLSGSFGSPPGFHLC